MKKILIILLSVFMLFAFVACDEEPEGTPGGGNPGNPGNPGTPGGNPGLDSPEAKMILAMNVVDEFVDVYESAALCGVFAEIDCFGGGCLTFNNESHKIEITSKGTAAGYKFNTPASPKENDIYIEVPANDEPKSAFFSEYPKCVVRVEMMNESPYYSDDLYSVYNPNYTDSLTSSIGKGDIKYITHATCGAFTADFYISETEEISWSIKSAEVTLNERANDIDCEYQITDSNDNVIYLRLTVDDDYNYTVSNATFNGTNYTTQLQSALNE